MTDRFFLFIFTVLAILGMAWGLSSIEHHTTLGIVFSAGAVYGIGLCGLVLFALIQINERNK